MTEASYIEAVLSEKDAKISRLMDLNARMAVEIVELRYKLGIAQGALELYLENSKRELGDGSPGLVKRIDNALAKIRSEAKR